MSQAQINNTQNIAAQNKVYYGEYSIEYWLKLLLSENIVLPLYQRSYVWGPEDVEALVDTIEANRFIPPITIGSYKDSVRQMNLIVDGQQRLTSILLAVLGWFPDKKKFESELFAREQEDAETDVGDDADAVNRGVMKWTFRELLRRGNQKLEDVERACRESKDYMPMQKKLGQVYLKNRYVGFCYLVPGDVRGTIDYFSNVFMDINANGVNLNQQEARRSLYFLAPDLSSLMEPGFLSDYGMINNLAKDRIGEVGLIERIDFIKYLSIMNEYYARSLMEHEVNIRRVAVGFRYQAESYYKAFIMFLSGRLQDSRFCAQSKWAYKSDYKTAIEAVRIAMLTMGIPHRFDSIVDMDVTFFGLIYWVCYCGKKLDGAKKSEFCAKLEELFLEFRTGANVNYLKSSSQLGKLRQRVVRSVNFYRGYLING